MRPKCDCSICQRGRAIVAEEQNMDSPNTRSRTKRALEEEGSGLEWRHDQDLRREVLKASEGEHFELPAPTQKPRPAVSSLAVSPSQIASSSSYRSAEPSTLGPRRKRPCRSTKLTTNGHVQVSRVASTAPPGSSSDGIKAILDRISRVALERTEEQEDDSLQGPAPSATLTNPDISPSQPGVLSPRSLNVQMDKSPLANCGPIKLNFGTRPTESVSSSSKTITAHRNPPLARQSSSRSSLASNTPQTPMSPIARNTGLAPRIGLRGGPAKPTQTVKPPRVQQPFKPPLLTQPIRSSPRRQPPPAQTALPSSSPHSSSSSRKSTRTPLRPPSDKPPPSRSSPKMPSSDGIGDDSFDWDEAFQDPKLVGMVDGK